MVMVWPNIFLMNVFFALKGSKPFIIIQQQGIPIVLFYGDLVYRFKKIMGKPNFSDL